MLNLVKSLYETGKCECGNIERRLGVGHWAVLPLVYPSRIVALFTEPCSQATRYDHINKHMLIDTAQLITPS